MALKRQTILNSDVEIEKAQKSKDLEKIVNSRGGEEQKKSKVSPTQFQSEEPEKKLIRTYYISAKNDSMLDKYALYLSYKSGKKISASSIVDELIGDFLNDKEF